MEQMTLFECFYEKYKITKPIRLIELFAGYGSQALALKYLGVKFEHWCICEWATKSIQAYNDLHIRDYTDYSKNLTQAEVIDKLASYGVSMNYNEPMTYEQIKRKGEDWQRKTYNNIIATHNLVNIQNAKAIDFNIVDTDKYEYILTYSFPCQDLSLAGKGKGMSRDSGTRSGMLWEVERILDECKEKPQILIMENVSQVIGSKNIKDFQEWTTKLESLGYSNYVECLNSKDYGIPQNRNRCFMVSILGEHMYKFSQPFLLKLRLKDLLESNVDEKYYLSDKMVNYISFTGTKNFKNPDCKINLEIGRPLTTDQNKRAGTTNYICDELPENFDLGFMIKEATKKGYAEAHEGDGVYINRPHQKRGVVQKGMIQTIKTSPDVGVVVYDDYNRKIRQDQNTIGTITTNIGHKDPRHGYKIIEYKDKELADTLQTNTKEGVVVKIGNYSPSGHNASSIVDKNGIAPTVMENHGTVTAVLEENRFYKQAFETLEKNQCDVGDTINAFNKIVDKSGLCPTITTRPEGFKTAILPVTKDLRIRKLTPKECFRLMGVKDEDFDNIKENQSDSSLYHLAGDSIVTTCLMAIFSELLGIDYITKITELTERLNENL